MNIKASDVCKIANNAFRKYLYSLGVQFFTGVIVSNLMQTYPKQLLDYWTIRRWGSGWPFKLTRSRIQSWGWSRSFIGLTSWPEEEEEEEEEEANAVTVFLCHLTFHCCSC